MLAARTLFRGSFCLRRRSGRADFADVTLGFNIRFTDEELFKELIFADPDATGSAGNEKQWAYLVEEGQTAGCMSPVTDQ